MDILSSLQTQFADMPLAIAALLGLLLAINPCIFAANAATQTFLSAESSTRNFTMMVGTLFAAGKSVSYIALAEITCLFADQINVDLNLSSWYSLIASMLFIIVGILLLDIVHFHGLEDAVMRLMPRASGHRLRRAFVSGMLIAFAFCPDGALIYFGVMIPLAMQSHTLLTAATFSLGAVLPTIILAFILAFSIEKASGVNHKIQWFTASIRKVLGFIFIAVGIWLAAEQFIHHTI